MGFAAALPAPEIDEDTATYTLGGGAELTATAMDTGFTADVVLSEAPASEPTYRFPLTLAGGLTPRLQGQILQFVDAKDKVVASSRPLQMWDAQRDEGGDPTHRQDLQAALVQVDGGWELDLTAPLSFLTDPATQYPVVVDPTVTLPSDKQNNTWYYNGNTSDRTDDYYLSVGKKNDSGDGSTTDRTYINFNTGPYTGKVVTGATLSLFQYLAGSCDPKRVNAYPTTTKSNKDASLVHTDEDTAWAVNASFNTGGDHGCAPPVVNAYQDVNVSKIVTGWAAGEIPAQQFGMELQAGTESDTSFYKRFCSENSAPTGTGHCEGTGNFPKLTITYKPDLGTQSAYENFTHKLNDRSQLSVNARYGNLVLKNSDLHVTGRNRDLSVDRFYNNQNSSVTGEFGPGWSMSVGPDVILKQVVTGNNDRFYYVAPGGTYYGPFVRKTSSGDTDGFFEPKFGGADVSLTDKGSGVYEMKFHHNQEKYTFEDHGCPTCNKLMTKDEDRNDNTLSFDYAWTGDRKLTTMTDTEGRAFNVHHNTSGLVDSISEATASYTPSPRTWAYGYTGSQLTTYTDPTGAVTNYTYAGGLVTQVTDPAQKDGKRPATKITYTTAQVSALDYFLNAAGTSTKRFTLAYSSDVAAARTACNTDDTWSIFTTITNVSDPQGGATKYCYKDRDEVLDPLHPDDNKPKQRVIDGKNHRRTVSFTPNNDVSTGSGQANSGETNGTTAFTYDANNNLTKAIQPKDDDTNSKTPGTTSFDYATDKNTVAGGEFLPSSTATTASSCSSMNYDTKGNLTDTYTGMAATSGQSTCSGKTSGRHNHVEYYKESDGDTVKFLPKSAYGPYVGAQYPNKDDTEIPDADKTVYTYEMAAPNVGKLAKVVRPGGSLTCTTDRTGCTTYTYDGRSRVVTLTDGNGKTTTYSYDADDRTTQVLTNGATTCTPTAGTCVKYDWDGEGNLASRVDIQGTTNFTYDWLNHPATQTQPDGTIIATGYDGAGNLTQYKQTLIGQTADTVNYTYDAANELTTLADATGSYTYTYDEDARPLTVRIPTASNATISYDYTHSGKVKSITPSTTTLPSYRYSYTDSNGNDDDQLRQVKFRNDTTIDYDYNSDDRLEKAEPSWSSGTTYSYTYNANGDIAGATTTINSADTTTHYGYNENDQLCWAGPNDGPSMDRNCPTTPSGDTPYTSDKQGNNLGTTTGPIHYNAQNQVDQISSPSGAGPVTQSYFDQGNNLRATAGSHTFTGGSQLGVTSRRNGSTGAVTYYTRDPNGQLIDTHGAGGTYHYLLDRQGSITALINSLGDFAGSYTYDPYGQTTITTTRGDIGAPAANPWRYTGGYQDPTDGYYKLGARYYDAAGHFTQADNIAGSLSRPEKYNSYSYTAGDPINNTDLSGQDVNGTYCAGSILAFGVAAVEAQAQFVYTSALVAARRATNPQTGRNIARTYLYGGIAFVGLVGAVDTCTS